MRLRYLAISGNIYNPDKVWEHHTASIWVETARHFEKTYVVVRNDKQRFARRSRGSVTVYFIPKGYRRMATFVLTSWLAPLYSILVRPSVVQTQSPVFGGPAAIVAARLVGASVVVEMHGDYYLDPSLMPRLAFEWFVHPITNFVLRRADSIRSLSPTMSEDICRVYGSHLERRIVEARNRVDLALFKDVKQHRPVDHLSIVLVGTLVERKGQLLLVEHLEQIGFDGSLDLVGDGEDRRALERRAEEVAFRVVVHGNLTHAKIAAVFANCDVYVQYSTSEALPRAILEAMASGLPVVSTAVGYIPDLIRDETMGVLLHSRGPEPLAAALDDLRDADRRSSISEKCLTVVRSEYEWSAVFLRYFTELKRRHNGN